VAFEIRILRPGDQDVLAAVADGVFDHPLDLAMTTEFLCDPRHHLAVAVENGIVVGMASAVHYVHPDKQPELWINEVGVAAAHRQRGIGKALLSALLEVGREHGCVQAWVLTERANTAAMRLYSAQGGILAPQEQVMFTFRLGAKTPKAN
jgi:ribosomal protein S18 acetylase RimI-like enzyme